MKREQNFILELGYTALPMETLSILVSSALMQYGVEYILEFADRNSQYEIALENWNRGSEEAVKVESRIRKEIVRLYLIYCDLKLLGIIEGKKK